MLTDHQWRNLRVRNRERATIDELRRAGFTVVWLTPYQCRINFRLDLYPTHQRWHDLKSGERGEYQDALAVCLERAQE